METFKINLNQDNVNIHLFGDEHIGDSNADLSYIKERIEKCRQDENGIAIVLGDVLNVAIKDSVSFNYSGLTPMQELNLAVELFEPIKDKIHLWLDGNHEDRIAKSTSLEVGRLIATELGVPYAVNSALLFVRFGDSGRQRPICYTIFCRHGSGGGAKVGSKMNKLSTNAEIVDADIYIQGHTHTPAVFQQDFFRLSFQNSSVDKVTHTFVNLGSSLNYGGYGEKFGFAPSTKSHPIVHLHNRKKIVTVTI